MITETLSTLGEYKQNYEKLRDEFVNAYEDNDEGGFISLQIEWYQKCLENTTLEHGFAGDTIGWFPISLLRGNGVIWEVNQKIRDENGGINQAAAQNLSVSFKKVLNFLHKEKLKAEKIKTGPSACQWALYYYVLQECKLKPRFKSKLKEISELSKDLGISPKTFQLKYNLIDHSHGLEGYRQVDVDVVEKLLEEKHPDIAVECLQRLTLNIF